MGFEMKTGGACHNMANEFSTYIPVQEKDLLSPADDGTIMAYVVQDPE